MANLLSVDSQIIRSLAVHILAKSIREKIYTTQWHKIDKRIQFIGTIENNNSYMLGFVTPSHTHTIIILTRVERTATSAFLDHQLSLMTHALLNSTYFILDTKPHESISIDVEPIAKMIYDLFQDMEISKRLEKLDSTRYILENISYKTTTISSKL